MINIPVFTAFAILFGVCIPATLIAWIYGEYIKYNQAGMFLFLFIVFDMFAMFSGAVYMQLPTNGPGCYNPEMNIYGPHYNQQTCTFPSENIFDKYNVIHPIAWTLQGCQKIIEGITGAVHLESK